MTLRDLGFDADIVEAMIAFRRETHAQPELAHQEAKTQDRLRTELERAGIEDVHVVFETGLVVDVHGKSGNRTIGFRGDLDALPIQEDRPDLPYCSRKPGVMHACGHDTHSAIALGIALQMHRNRDRFPGTARFWFQPAEEAEPLGGRAFFEEGWLDGVDAAIGVHVNPAIESGKIGVLPGVVNCSSDEWSMTVTGKSSHGGKPHEGIDSIAISAAIIQEIQLIVARTSDPDIPLVITVGTIKGGTATNVVCDRVDLSGTIRTRDNAVRDATHERLRRLAQTYETLHGARIEIDIRKGEPATDNDPRMCELIRQSARRAIGAENIADCAPWTASDDFGFYTDAVPGVYYWYGCYNEAANNVHALHHPKFGVLDDDMVIAAKVGLTAMCDYLENGLAASPG